jgi:transcription-repair coupling factor (superfamily II helicase)
MDGPAHLPEDYIPDPDAKLDFYRRLARTDEVGDIAVLRVELRDRFGRLPEEADRLLTVFELRVLGAKLGVQAVVVRGDEARLKFRQGVAPRMAGLTAALDGVQFAAEVRQMIPLALRLRRLGGLEIGPGLVRAFATALERDGATAVNS